MTPDQIARVEASLLALGPELDRVAEDFYGRLFAAAPDTRALFSTDPKIQAAVFAAELRATVFLIRDHRAFRNGAANLGSRHHARGVRAAHYRVARPHLLAALAHASGDRWSAETEDAWCVAYNLVAELMMQGGATHLSPAR